MRAFAQRMKMKNDVPESLAGIPVLNNMRAWFFVGISERKDDDIQNLWELFEAAIRFADAPSDETRTRFTSCYDKAVKQQGIKWNITIGLYWIRPYVYINLDDCNRTYLQKETITFAPDLLSVSNLKQLPPATEYLKIISDIKTLLDKTETPFHSFPELSRNAWIEASSAGKKKISAAGFLKWFAPVINALKELGGSAAPEDVRKQIISDYKLTDDVVSETTGKTKQNKFASEVDWARNYLLYDGYIDKSVKGMWTLTEKGKTSPMNELIASDIFMKSGKKEHVENTQEPKASGRNKNEIRYWLYTPGEGSKLWNEFYSGGIMGIGWDEMDDLKQYSSKDAMKLKMKELYGQEYTYMNAAHATWQFANELQAGDIVYAKKGLYKIIGRGIVDSDYIFDANRSEYKHIRKIIWTHNGEWDHPGSAVVKTLTDITSYTQYVQKLEALFFEESDTVQPEQKEVAYDEYTEKDFLEDVFMDPDQYEVLVRLFLTKKNIILQGAPGVGKTFAAKRLAYSIMGTKDSSRVLAVQFHQSYSYEDFIMGYRPTKEGFELVKGPFYQFCKTAQDDGDRDYFFIIDEINRGNLSKIFGELMMLIEADKRGESLRLLYENELFSVPKNVYIIGLMNTADRSLAMIDYALRRRFAFFEMEPAFDSVGFKAYLEKANHEKFTALTGQIKALNEFISKDEALGDGFRIGHSYLCKEDVKEITDGWLHTVVEYELIPMLNEYWFDERDKIRQWTDKLRGALK
jgi:5-methylcytosine-specific restriction protein B